MDERDINSLLELEQYVKERKHILRWKEFLLLQEKVKSFDLVSVHYRRINKMNPFDVIWVFLDGEGKEFQCFSRVSAKDKGCVRHRNMLKNIEDISSISSLYRYLDERCFLLNSYEFVKLAQFLQQWNIDKDLHDEYRLEGVEWKNVFEEERPIFIPSFINMNNQVSGHYYMYFKQGVREMSLDTYIMKYNQFARERRREDV